MLECRHDGRKVVEVCYWRENQSVDVKIIFHLSHLLILDVPETMTIIRQIVQKRKLINFHITICLLCFQLGDGTNVNKNVLTNMTGPLSANVKVFFVCLIILSNFENMSIISTRSNSV